MFEAITWTDFILSLGIGATVYYTAIILLYFTPDLKRLIRWHKEPVKITSGEIVNGRHALMGETRSSSQTMHSATSHLEESTQIISSVAEDDNDRTWSSTQFVTQPLHRSFAQLLEEINALAYIVAQNSKEEIALLFETLLSRYPQLAKPHHQSSINQFIIEACQQHGETTLSHKDIDEWWTQALGNSHTIK